jgi:hypothetical protein
LNKHQTGVLLLKTKGESWYNSGGGAQADIKENIPLFHPTTVRINALCSSRSRRGILYNLQKDDMLSAQHIL